MFLLWVIMKSYFIHLAYTIIIGTSPGLLQKYKNMNVIKLILKVSLLKVIKVIF